MSLNAHFIHICTVNFKSEPDSTLDISERGLKTGWT